MSQATFPTIAQVLELVPATQLVVGLYAAHPAFCNVILDTIFSLLTAIFTFIVLPAGDFIIGQEPPEAVRGPPIGRTPNRDVPRQTVSWLGSLGHATGFRQSAAGSAMRDACNVMAILCI